MQLEHKYIYMVYQEGSISKAAEKLFITQPALSRRVHGLEEQLGYKLFLRSKGVTCTIRESKGLDISAACGQLKERTKELENSQNKGQK